MTDKNLPSIDYLHKRLRYEPETGKLFWRDCEEMPKWWRARFAGKEAFSPLDGMGYRHGSIDGVLFKAHRVIWAIHYDDPGELEIDHINHDVRDSRIENLRIVTHQENKMNKSSYEQQSGHCGVHWDGQKSRWRVCLAVDGKTKWLGRYKDKGKAIEARKEAEKRFGYHENHGVKK